MAGYCNACDAIVEPFGAQANWAQGVRSSSRRGLLTIGEGSTNHDMSRDRTTPRSVEPVVPMAGARSARSMPGIPHRSCPVRPIDAEPRGIVRNCPIDETEV
jgi:hypothetical protein